MADELKFFSQEWCDAAREATNANPKVYNGFADPETWTNKMEFGTVGRDDLVTHLEWEKGKLVSWTPRKFDESELWVILNADLETWQKAAAGEELGAKLLLAGKMKLVKGPVSAAIQNGNALNNFLRTWGQVPTDWDV